MRQALLSGLLALASATAYGDDFSGTVSVDQCSASVVRFEQSQDEDRALILTSGHCVSLMAPGEVLSQSPSQRDFFLLDREGNYLATLPSDQLVYATMTDTNLALYRLTLSYEQLRTSYQSEALVLSSEDAQAGDELAILSAYWKRTYHCALEAIVPAIKEHHWQWPSGMRYSRPGCETMLGTTGSPLVLPGTRKVVGLHSTYNENGQACTYQNPCEVSDNGTVVVERGRAYGLPTSLLYSCLNTHREIDLSLAGCRLPKPKPRP